MEVFRFPPMGDAIARIYTYPVSGATELCYHAEDDYWDWEYLRYGFWGIDFRAAFPGVDIPDRVWIRFRKARS